MELSSHQEGQIPISIPIPINTSYGASSHLRHMIHHHQHQQDPSSTLTHTLIHNSHLSSVPLVPPQESHDHQIHVSINNNGSSIPTRSTTSPNQEEENEDHEDHDEHANIVNVTYTHINSSTNNNNKVAKVVNNIKYKECLKNHAATIGGNATDGCGEFMPSGEEGSIEALTCSACNCHRNFHRKETQGELKTDPFGRKVLLGLHPNGHKNNLSIVATSNATTGGFLPSRTAPHHYPHMIMSYNNNMGMMGTHFPSESDEQEQDQTTHHNYHGHSGRAALQVVKKRYRTKFTQEQKEKLFHFAEKVGWKIQKQEESVVQSFCHEIGVERRVLKVWMHNNKHNLAKNNNNNKSPLPQPSTTTHA